MARFLIVLALSTLLFARGCTVVPELVQITIPVVVHNILHSTGYTYVSDDTIARQLGVLNSAYAPAKISFRLARIDRRVNNHWSDEPNGYGSASIEMEHAYLSMPENDPRACLNVFIVDLGKEWDGFSSLPWEASKLEDAVIVDYSTLAGVSKDVLGYTLVHEVGHWLGLYHTFENGCNPPGDDVDDTPYEAQPSFDGRFHDTCKQPGLDPVNNFMDYTPDITRHEFTYGQINRMRSMIHLHRHHFLI